MADHRERDTYYSQTDPRSKNDDPPNSRLFVICHKSLEEDDLRKAFEKFGKIEDIWVVKDRNTGENKGNFLYSFFLFFLQWKLPVISRVFRPHANRCRHIYYSLFLL